MDDTDKTHPGSARTSFSAGSRTCGYLENPLDKFFIGGSHGRTGVLVANLKIAAKVGVLGGVFLGVVTALGLAAPVAGDVPHLRPPLAKLALYFFGDIHGRCSPRWSS